MEERDTFPRAQTVAARRRPDISLGDLLRAVTALRTRHKETRAEIVRQLGFEPMVDIAPPTIGPWKPSSSNPEPPVTTTHEPGSVPEPAQPSVPETLAANDDRPMRPSRLERLPPQTLARPAWAQQTGVMDSAAVRGPSPSPPDLFAPLRRRAIVAAVLTTWERTGSLDLDAILATVTAVRPLRTIPRLHAPVLQRPVQVLHDLSQAMAPYRSDADALLRQLGELLSRNDVSVYRFSGTPLSGVTTASRQGTTRWAAPPPGSAVLILSTLGIVQPPDDDAGATSAQWLEFARVARRELLKPVCLVPFEAREWPPEITRLMSCIHWSERTTAAAIVRALRPERRSRA
jgi:hypothetical protein